MLTTSVTAFPLWSDLLNSDWRDEAACAGKHWLFENLDYDHPLALNMTYEERWNLTQVNHEAARRLCAACPVRLSCMADSAPEDTEYTLRARVGPMVAVSLDYDRTSWLEAAPACVHWHEEGALTCDGCVYDARKKLNSALARAGSMV